MGMVYMTCFDRFGELYIIVKPLSRITEDRHLYFYSVTYISTDLCPVPATCIIRLTELQRQLPSSQLLSLRMSYGYLHCNFIKISNKKAVMMTGRSCHFTISMCRVQQKCAINMSQHECFQSVLCISRSSNEKIDFSNIHIRYKITKDGRLNCSNKSLGHIVSFQALTWLKIHYPTSQSRNSRAIYGCLSVGIV